MDHQRPIELKAIDSIKEQDGDLEYLKGTNESQVDFAHYTVTKVYGVSFKFPAFFAAAKELKSEGLQLEPQIDYQNEKIILVATRHVSSSDDNAEASTPEEQQER